MCHAVTKDLNCTKSNPLPYPLISNLPVPIWISETEDGMTSSRATQMCLMVFFISKSEDQYVKLKTICLSSHGIVSFVTSYLLDSESNLLDDIKYPPVEHLAHYLITIITFTSCYFRSGSCFLQSLHFPFHLPLVIGLSQATCKMHFSSTITINLTH